MAPITRGMRLKPPPLPPPPPPITPTVHPVTLTRADLEEANRLHHQLHGFDWRLLFLRVGCFGTVILLVGALVDWLPWLRTPVGLLLIGWSLIAAIKMARQPDSASLDLMFDEASATLLDGSGSTRIPLATRTSWVVGESVTLLYGRGRRHYVVVHGSLPILVQRDFHATLESALGPCTIPPSTLESRLSEPSKALAAMIAVLAPMVAYVAIATWDRGGNDSATGPVSAESTVIESSDDPVEGSTDTQAAFNSSDLGLPLQERDVPENCGNVGTADRPDWMCWDSTGQPEWSSADISPGCRMVPYRGNMYMDCEGASGPGR